MRAILINRKFKMMENRRSIKKTERSRVGFVILFCLAGTGNGFLEGASVAAYCHTFISGSGQAEKDNTTYSATFRPLDRACIFHHFELAVHKYRTHIFSASKRIPDRAFLETVFFAHPKPLTVAE